MEFTVNGHEVPIDQVTYREVGYGQPVASETRACLITLPREEAIRQFEEVVKEFALATKADAKYRRPGVWPHLDKWGALGYPGFSALWNEAPHLAEHFLAESLALESVLPLMLPGKREEARIVINKIRRARLTPSELVFEAEVFLIQ